MVVKILKSKGTSAESLKYNEDKVKRGVATIIDRGNLMGLGFYGIHKTFEAYESNPDIDAKTKNVSLHFSVNPGPEDTASEAQVLAFIHEYLDRTGYAKQPFVIFRHNDIERPHYHVVSLNVDSKGKCIRYGYENSNYSKSVTRHLVDELGPKYGFILGKNPVLEEFESLKVTPYVVKNLRPYLGVEDLTDTYGYLYDQALQFNFRSLSEYQDILTAYGIKSTLREGQLNHRKNIFLQTVSNSGKTLTPEINLDKIKGNTFGKGEGWTRYVARQAENNIDLQPSSANIIRLQSVFEELVPRCTSMEELRNALQVMRMDIIVHRDKPVRSDGYRKGEKLKPIQRITIVDKDYHSVYGGERAAMIIDPLWFIRAEESGQWKSEYASALDARKIVTKDTINRINARINERTQAQERMNVAQVSGRRR